MKESVREEPKIVAAAERQMREWAMHEEMLAHMSPRPSPDEVRRSIRPFVAISRETGAGGGEIGSLVASKLCWELFDSNLLDAVALRYHEDRRMLELVDETESNWVFDVLGTWMDRQIVPHEKFVAQLIRVMLAAARRAHGVFVGRGAQFILPRDRGLAIRLVAPEAFRIERIMRLRNCSSEAAKTYVRETDRGRTELAGRYFHHDIGDPHLYDLVINTGRFGIVESAEQIIAAVRARGY